MPSVLQTSRIPILMVPVPVVAEAAQQQGVPVDPLVFGSLPQLLTFLTSAVGHPVLLAAGQVWLASANRWTTAKFTMLQQPATKTRWCWATVAGSVAQSYHPGTPWTQCEIAKAVVHQQDCCLAGPSCNSDQKLDPALAVAGVLRQARHGKAVFGELSGGEIALNRSVGWRICWNQGGGGHFAVIYAFQVDDTGVEWLAIADPIPQNGQSTLSMAQLTAGAYLGGGKWTDTFFTQP